MVKYCVIVPANFIKFYSRGDTLKNGYKYWVYWRGDDDDNGTRIPTTPTEYLKSGSVIPNFEEGLASEHFGEPGCYRALVFGVRVT